MRMRAVSLEPCREKLVARGSVGRGVWFVSLVNPLFEFAGAGRRCGALLRARSRSFCGGLLRENLDQRHPQASRGPAHVEADNHPLLQIPEAFYAEQPHKVEAEWDESPASFGSDYTCLATVT